MGASPLPVDSKPLSGSAEAFIAANTRKLGALLVLFLLGGLGLGTKVWLGFEEASVDLNKVVSGHEVCCITMFCTTPVTQVLQLSPCTGQTCWHNLQLVPCTRWHLCRGTL